MKIRLSLMIIPFFYLLMPLQAQNYYKNGPAWIEKAEQLKTDLIEQIVHPVAVIEVLANEDAFQGWEANKVAEPEMVYSNSFRQQKSVILDFGDHYTGYFSFDLETLWGTSDAPVRFRLTFGEVLSEMTVPFDTYEGVLSRAWLQDEVVTIMSVPCFYKLERRVSFRYLKIELLGSSQYFDFRISDMQVNAVTSASNKPASLAETTPEKIVKIDQIGLNTLKECMQTVYEDGPKRDRRLWVGDLYLESLANQYSFENHQLTRRCLYLLAGLSDDEGYVLGTVFEEPEPHAQAGQRLMDYSLLFNVTLKEYLAATSDYETTAELWKVAKRQLDIIDHYVSSEGLVNYKRANDEWWLFFDWKEGLHKHAAIQGLMIYTLQQTYALAEMLERKDEVSHIPDQIKLMKKAAIHHFYNKKTGLFESGDDRQISYASQIWMIMAGVLNEKQSQKALQNVMKYEQAIRPGGPYLYHYFIQSLINSKMYPGARQSMIKYWGGMVDKGADTFWEVFSPENDFLSPYNSILVNSYCHAWSCTPVYFIRKYPEIFQE